MIPRIMRVAVRNYKSLAQVSVDLEPFTTLVGRNGAGKSNFIDALCFVQECLSQSIEFAFKKRGGISAVRRRSGGHGGRPTNIEMRFDLELGQGFYAEYAFRITARPPKGFQIAGERCAVRPVMGQEHVFEVNKGNFTRTIQGIRPKVAADRLALYAASATEEFRPAYDFLASMRFYSVTPEQVRQLQEPDSGDFLKRDGSNAAAVLRRLRKEDPTGKRYERLCQLLARAVEGVEGVEPRSVSHKETLRFKQNVGLKHPWFFEALNMSDGTLRVLGLLLSIYQPSHASLVAIEEPEATVHPAIADLVTEVLVDAANDKQILVTTHSPDLLDHKELTDTQLRVVTMEGNRTAIASVSPPSRAAIREHLYTPGELLRSDELNPDPAAVEKMAQQLDLFQPLTERT